MVTRRVFSTKSIILGLFFSAFLTGALESSPSPADLTLIRRLEANTDFSHKVGMATARGWALDHKRNHPGYALVGPREPILLEPGYYRATFVLRRGHYPNKGFLNRTYGVARIELWDATAKEMINERELQRSDFPSSSAFEHRWMNFSMENRTGHLIEPRVYWLGLANMEVEAVLIERFPDVSGKDLEEKALRLGELQEKEFLENGFVVVRKPDGSAGDIGDAMTYTGLYAASLAWKYGVTRNELTLQALENTINQMHNGIKGSSDEPLITRFVDDHGNPHYDSPSKDVYTSFFLAYSAAYPLIQNEALKKQMRLDVQYIGDRFLQDNLTIKGGPETLVSLTPYFTEAEVRNGIRKMIKDKKTKKQIVKGLKQARKMAPFVELWPGIKQTIKYIEKGDEDKIFGAVVPTLNGIAGVVERARDILREQHRTDLFPIRFRYKEYPGKQLEAMLTETLKKFPPKKSGRRFDRLVDLPILSSNALLSLHIVRTAGSISQKSEFFEYYKTNLYTQDALLKCALDWFGMEEELLRLTAGNAVADRERRGYLSALALFNLIQLEKNPEVLKRYKQIFDVYWRHNRNEDNPMSVAFQNICSLTPPTGAAAIMRALQQYPEDRMGYGDGYWSKHAAEVAKEAGGMSGEENSREPVPISLRPKDSFLWQRNARRLNGDSQIKYPATDYLFVYWLSRYYGILPEPEKAPTVKP